MPHPLATRVGAGRLVTASIAAPSVHNTQPWRFRVPNTEIIELHVDPNRLLHVIDPRGRAMLISCGAALFNLRLAVRVTGHRPLVWAFPDELDEPTLLASVRVVESSLPGPGSAALHEMIPHRRTNRGPFSHRMLPRYVLHDLVAAAWTEGVRLGLPDPQATARLLRLIESADEELTSDADYVAELARWTSHRAGSDGIPWYTFGPRPSGRGAPVRDFGLGRPHPDREVDDFAGRPRMALLITDGDGPEDWLRAGQALQRVLLTAARHGVSASFLTQPLDVRDMGRGPAAPGPLEHTQMILRLGYGPPVPGSPRRPFPEVLDTC